MEELAHEVMARCDILARYSEDPKALTRTFLTLPFKDVHADVSAWMQEAGMEVKVDAIGNIIGHYKGKRKDVPRFLIGSHLDTVRNAGKYDGMLGVLVGIAVVKALKGKKLPFALDVIGFSEEEGVRFGATYFGSQTLTGSFDPHQLDLRDRNGISMREAIERFGLNPDEIASAKYDKKQTLGYAEVHIEQGPVLESLNQPLGIAEAIIGQSKLELSFVGKAGHAGTAPMHLRKDALTGAAEFVLSVESFARKTEGLVATVGKLETRPGASNVIPGEVALSLDVRHKNDKVRADAVTTLLGKAQVIASERELKLYHKQLLDAPTAPMNKTFTNLLLSQSKAPRMVSGAGHDASVMSHFTQSVLIFVRSPGGISHHPHETVLGKDVAAAIATLKSFLESLEEAYV
ncbi:MAG: allantoate amidohydrolase [Trueperaceae bacterium]|nr:allantoate amidohydrolase [Trueperaceae bacterium]